MAQFYRKQDDPTVYTGYDPNTGQFSGGIESEAQAQKVGVIPDWEASWKPAGSTTNIQTITPESLSTTKAYDLSGQPKNAINDADVAVVGAEEQAKIDAKVKVDTEAAKKSLAESDILKTLTELESEGTAQATAEQEAGIPGFQQQQADVTGQIAVKTAEYNQLKAQEEALKTQFEGMAGITLSEVSGRKGVIERQFLARKNAVASEISLLNATSLAISGKQIAAQGAVDRAIDLKYDSKRQKLDTQKFLYDVIRGDLTKAEEAQLKIQEEKTAREEAVLEDQKAIEKANYTTLLSLLQKYPDAQITLQDTIEQANQKIAQNSAIYRQQTRLAGRGGGDEITPTEEPLSINAIDQFRRSYGWTPPFGFTENQLLQFMKDNPDASPEELEAGAKQALAGQGGEITQPQTSFPDTVGHIMNTITDDEMTALWKKAKTAGVTKLFRLKRGDVQAYLETFKSQIEEAINQGYSKEEIKQYILGL